MDCQTQLKAAVFLHSGAIGDCLLTLPLAQFMKHEFRLDRIDFIGSYDHIDFYPQRTFIDGILSAESLGLHRLFAEAQSFDLPDDDRLTKAFGKYEYIVSFLGAGHPTFEQNLLFAVHSIRSSEVILIPSHSESDTTQHVSDFYLDCFKHDQQLEGFVEPQAPQITPLPEDFSAGHDILLRHNIDLDANVVLIHPGSGSLEKCWHWENYFQTASDLKSNGIQPVFLLGPAEQERFDPSAIQTIRQFPVIENPSLTQVLQVLTQADAFLGNDSGIGHLAAGMGKKSLILFGPSSPAHYAPRGPKVKIEQIPLQQFRQFESNIAARIINSLLNML